MKSVPINQIMRLTESRTNGKREVPGGKEKPACAGFLKKKQKRNSITWK
jgi:hypothetical protein